VAEQADAAVINRAMSVATEASRARSDVPVEVVVQGVAIVPTLTPQLEGAERDISDDIVAADVGSNTFEH
jgi:hypothetical protein